MTRAPDLDGSGAPGSRHGGPRGFTLIELIVSMVLGTFVMGSIYQVLVTNQRISALQTERVLGQQTVRAGLDVLSQELRESSAAGGDLLVMQWNRIQFRALRSFGIACTVVNSLPPVLTVAVEGNDFEQGQGIFVFADGDETTSRDDRWYTLTALGVVNGQTCGTQALPAQRITLSGPLLQAGSDSIRRGAIVRGFETVTYQTAVYDGDTYLVRTVGLETARIVGPIQGTGLRFLYFDADGNITAVPANVRRVRIALLVRSDARDQAGEQLADSLTTSVYLRN